MVDVGSDTGGYTRGAMSQPGDTSDNFDAPTGAKELIASQGKRPLDDPSILLGDFWPEDEPVEDFLAALHEWRGRGRSDRAA